MRGRVTEEMLAGIFDVSQPTVSRAVTTLTPVIDEATQQFRPDAEAAKAAIKNSTALVDGTLWPCWSWRGRRELWAGKYRTRSSRT